MNDTTRRVLSDLKALIESRKRMEEAGLLDEEELKTKIGIEERMRWEISECMREAHRQAQEKKKAEEKAIGQMAYKLERKIREVKRLQEEEAYRRQVEERYAERLMRELAEKEEKERNVRQQLEHNKAEKEEEEEPKN
ncbi:unnamed protein product [Caenorhabditis sp. 36 PRJEB53466]|nr:unnamed protein product [Caenorhabditis sp. 36 PRJEB53466]